jgi:hypothetical protein
MISKTVEPNPFNLLSKSVDSFLFKQDVPVSEYSLN